MTAFMLVILASLGVVIALVGGWVRSTLLDTDSFMEVVEPSLASEEVITLLGDAISEQVVVAIELEGRLEPRLAAIDAYLAETLVEALDLPSATKALLARSNLPRLANLAGAKWIKALQQRQSAEGALRRLDAAIAEHRDAFIAGASGPRSRHGGGSVSLSPAC